MKVIVIKDESGVVFDKKRVSDDIAKQTAQRMRQQYRQMGYSYKITIQKER